MVDTSKMFDGINWDSIKPQEDFSSEIVALRGDYKGVVKEFKWVEYKDGGFYSLNVQITETVKGVKGENRFIGRTFNVAATEWSTEEENKDRLLVALKTIGVTKPEDAVGKTICMKLRQNKDKRDKNGWPVHIMTIVNGFKAPSEGISQPEATTNVPF